MPPLPALPVPPALPVSVTNLAAAFLVDLVEPVGFLAATFVLLPVDLGLDATLLEMDVVFDGFLVTTEVAVDLVFGLAVVVDIVVLVVVMGGALLVGSTLNLLTAGSF